jgi:hypothetical protein
MMVTAEYHAMPRRVIFGSSAEDFVDEAGRPMSALSRVAGRAWVFENSEGRVEQFNESSLSNYHETIKLLAQLVASVSGLPPHYLGSTTDNPASADAIRSSEARLVKRVERKQRAFGEAWEQVMRLALLVADGSVSPDARGMETVWRDAAVKLHTAGITPLRTTRERLGFSQVQIARMEAEDQEAADRAAAAFGLGPNPQMPGDAAAMAAAQAVAIGEPIPAQSTRVTYTAGSSAP